MKFIRYVDFALDEENIVENIKMPTDLPIEEILTISPMINGYGAIYKNVTILYDRYGNQYKVQGNYKDIIQKVRGPRLVVKGFKI